MSIQQEIFSNIHDDQKEILKNENKINLAGSSVTTKERSLDDDNTVDLLLLLMRNVELEELEERNSIIHESLSPEKFKSLLQLQGKLDEVNQQKQPMQ